MAKMSGALHDKNGWNSLDGTGVELLLTPSQEWVELTLAKMDRAHSVKNGWSSLWQKWPELWMAKMGFAGDIDTVANMGGDHHCKHWDLEYILFSQKIKDKSKYILSHVGTSLGWPLVVKKVE